MEHHGASPGPAGLVAFAVACYTFFGLFIGFVPSTGLPMLSAWLMGGFVVQIIVAKMELEHGELLGGNVFCFFQGFFMLTGAISCFFKWLCPILGVAYDVRVEGLGWGACTLALILWSPAYFKKSNGTFSLAIISTDIALVLISLKDLGFIGGAAVSKVIAFALLIAGTLGIYVASAVQLNSAFGKTVLPLLPPLIKSEASETA
ncbi:MAG TPA: hypothetical protein DD735_09900 [Clostridiales bacterium]|jgi:hypothetical protein|nr:hypothetical protein [Clostridiales bacterium]